MNMDTILYGDKENNELTRLLAELKDMTAERDRWQALRAENAELHKSIDNLNDRLCVVRSNKKQLDEDLTETEAAFDKLIAENAELQKNYDELDAGHNKLFMEYTNLRAELDQVSRERDRRWNP
jgi:chromosome segregation ATPase